MSKTEGDAVFVSAAKKTNMEYFRNRVYQKVREQHITRFPYNHFLYTEIEVEE
jgi:GTP-binding protein HflX